MMAVTAVIRHSGPPSGHIRPPRSPADRGVAGGRGGAGQQSVDRAADVVEAHEEGAGGGVADGGQGAGVGDDALELVEVEAERVGDDRLDDVAVGADEVHGGGGGGGQPVVPVANGRDRPRRHRGQGLAAGEAGGAGVVLHDRPVGVAPQVVEVAAGPVPVVALGEPLVLGDRGSGGRGDRRGGLDAPLHRAGDDGVQAQRGESAGGLLGLGAAPAVQVQAGGASGEAAAGDRGQAVADEQQGGGGFGRLRLRWSPHGASA